jgi:hypothetical protein
MQVCVDGLQMFYGQAAPGAQSGVARGLCGRHPNASADWRATLIATLGASVHMTKVQYLK